MYVILSQKKKKKNVNDLRDAYAKWPVLSILPENEGEGTEGGGLFFKKLLHPSVHDET